MGGVKHPHPAAINAFHTFSYRSQKAFILVIPRREELQHFTPLHLSAEEKRIQAAVPCSQAEDGMISPLCPPFSVISLLPRVSLQLFEETQEVCRNVPPQFAVYTARRTARRPTQQSCDARYGKPACTHNLSYCRRRSQVSASVN